MFKIAYSNFSEYLKNYILPVLQTRILVTHALTHLPKADLIVCIKDGQISEMGAYNDLLSHNGAFAELIQV